MPPRGHGSTPKFIPDVPRELQRYFKELELLFGPAQVVDDTEKKKHACRYVDINTTDLWEANEFVKWLKELKDEIQVS
jgi:hypothetical protein